MPNCQKSQRSLLIEVKTKKEERNGLKKAFKRIYCPKTNPF